MNPYAWLAALALAVGAYLIGRHDGRQLSEGEAAIAERVSAGAAKAGREAAATAISRITVRHTTVQNALEREVRNVPVYTDPDCRLESTTLRMLNEAISGDAGAGHQSEVSAQAQSRASSAP